jgi:hypothetical protein
VSERKGRPVAKRKGGRLGHSFRGRSEHDDSGDASLGEAFDAAATAAVLNAITEDQEVQDEIRAAAADALAALEAGSPDANERAIDASRLAVEQVGHERFEFTFDVQIEIETRPHNQWVRAFSVIAHPKS